MFVLTSAELAVAFYRMATCDGENGRWSWLNHALHFALLVAARAALALGLKARRLHAVPHVPLHKQYT
eukprot:6205865-Pleurochrysis_carterae.AAC.1